MSAASRTATYPVCAAWWGSERSGEYGAPAQARRRRARAGLITIQHQVSKWVPDTGFARSGMTGIGVRLCCVVVCYTKCFAEVVDHQMAQISPDPPSVAMRCRAGFAVLLAIGLVAGCGQQTAPAQQSELPGQAAPIRAVELAIPAKFDEAGMFDGGLAPVRMGGKFGYADTKGDMVIAPQFDFAGRFSEELAAAGIGSRQGYIDKSGMFVLSPQFEIADLSPFSEGLAPVRIGEFVAAKWGYIDKQGNVVIQPQFDAAGPFSDGLAVAAIGGQWGYIDRTGNVVVAMQYASAGSFADGLAAVRTGDPVTGKTGYIDKTGRMVIAPQFDGAFSFSDGLAAVRVGNKYGFIGKDGKIVIPARFDFADSFSGPLAAFRQGAESDGKYGYLDRTGKVAIDPQFDFADMFARSDGLAAVREGDEKSGMWGYVGIPKAGGG